MKRMEGSDMVLAYLHDTHLSDFSQRRWGGELTAILEEVLMNVFEKIKDAITIRELLEDYGFPYTEGGIYCPLPEHEATVPGFKVFTSDSGFEAGHCFSPNCEFHGDVIELEMALTGVSVGEAVRNLATRFGVEIPEWSGESTKELEESRNRRKQLEWLYGVVIDFAHEVLVDATVLGFDKENYATYRQDPEGALLLGNKIVIDEVGQKRASMSSNSLQTWGFTDDTIRTWKMGYFPISMEYFWPTFLAAKAEAKASGVTIPDDILTGSGLFAQGEGTEYGYELPKLIPVMGGRLVFPFGEASYMQGRIVKKVRPTWTTSKYVNPLSKSKKYPMVWAEASKPLVMSPAKMSVLGHLASQVLWWIATTTMSAP